jgi:hypothetical protein
MRKCMQRSHRIAGQCCPLAEYSAEEFKKGRLKIWTARKNCSRVLAEFLQKGPILQKFTFLYLFYEMVILVNAKISSLKCAQKSVVLVIK